MRLTGPRGARHAGGRLLLRALRVAVASTSVASWLAAQDAPAPGISAPVPLKRPPVALPQTSAPTGKPVRIVICQRSGPTDHPPLWVLDGVRLGLRPDGTVDHEAAQRLLSKLNPNEVVSIEILKSVEATARFGPGAHQGAVLIRTSLADSSHKGPTTPKRSNP